jgi:hypothetical protein
MHELLLESFQHQTYEGEMELVVFDGECKRSVPRRSQKNPETGALELHDSFRSDVFDAAMLADKRIMYHFDPAKRARSLGKKRAWMAENSDGAVIVHFDDDDFYGPEYIETMVRHLVEQDADMVKLHSWALYGDMRDASTGTKERRWAHIDYASSYLKHSFGFTFVFRRELLAEVPYPDPLKGQGEDFQFAKSIVYHEETDFKVATIPDEDCLVLRIVCYGVHRYSGMPDPKHLAGGTLTILDESFADKCVASDIDAHLDKVDFVYLKHEEDALQQFEKENPEMPVSAADEHGNRIEPAPLAGFRSHDEL